MIIKQDDKYGVETFNKKVAGLTDSLNRAKEERAKRRKLERAEKIKRFFILNLHRLNELLCIFGSHIEGRQVDAWLEDRYTMNRLTECSRCQRVVRLQGFVGGWTVSRYRQGWSEWASIPVPKQPIDNRHRLQFTYVTSPACNLLGGGFALDLKEKILTIRLGRVLIEYGPSLFRAAS